MLYKERNMIKKKLEHNIDTHFDGMQESLEYMQTTINDLFSSLNKIRYMMWLKEEVEKENL